MNISPCSLVHRPMCPLSNLPPYFHFFLGNEAGGVVGTRLSILLVGDLWCRTIKFVTFACH